MGRPTRAKNPIKSAALRLFVERGIDGAGIRDVASAAGYTEAALYRHWSGKEALVQDLYHEHLTEVVERMDAAIAGADHLAGRLRAAIAAIYDLYDAEPLVFRFVLLTSHDTRTALLDYGRTPLDIVHDLVLEAGRGKPAGLPPDNLAAAITGVFLETAVYVLYGRLPGPLASHTDPVWRLALRLLEVEPEIPGRTDRGSAGA